MASHFAMTIDKLPDPGGAMDREIICDNQFRRSVPKPGTCNWGGSLIALGSILSKAFSGNFLEHFALPFCWFMTARRRLSRMLQEAMRIKDESESIQSKQGD